MTYRSPLTTRMELDFIEGLGTRKTCKQALRLLQLRPRVRNPYIDAAINRINTRMETDTLEEFLRCYTVVRKAPRPLVIFVPLSGGYPAAVDFVCRSVLQQIGQEDLVKTIQASQELEK